MSARKAIKLLVQMFILSLKILEISPINFSFLHCWDERFPCIETSLIDISTIENHLIAIMLYLEAIVIVDGYQFLAIFLTHQLLTSSNLSLSDSSFDINSQIKWEGGSIFDCF